MAQGMREGADLHLPHHVLDLELLRVNLHPVLVVRAPALSKGNKKPW